MAYTVEQPRPDVLIVSMAACAGWSQRFLLRSDAHTDNLHSDLDLQKRHLEQAKEDGAGVIDGGDLFCAMQGRFDKRADPRQLRPDLYAGTAKYYGDGIIDFNVDFLEPYKESLIACGPGNHETSWIKRHEHDLTQSLCDRLKVPKMTYASWVGFRFTINKTKRNTIWMYRHHGYGGGGPVTRGVIQTNRMAVYLPDASIVWTGHTHDGWIMPIERARLSSMGVPYLDTQLHIRSPGYKDEFSCSEGWNVERGGPPKPKGAIWLEFRMDNCHGNRVSYEARLAT